jgi:lipid II:glycine glycyltransferase (peptidoglycan interpeptide bridge formation enzyme)
MRFFLRERLTVEQSKRLNRYVAENPYGSLFQQPRWAPVQGETRFTPYVFFWAEEAGEIAASALVRRHKLPRLRWAKDTVMRGPVCSSHTILSEAISELARALQTIGSASLKLNPYWQQPAAMQLEADLAAMGFHPLPAGPGPHSTTLLIDLAPDEQKILQRFRKATRHAIKRAEAMAVTVAPIKDESEIRVFCSLYQKMAVARSFQPLGLNFLVRLWREILAGERDGLFLVAHYREEIVSGLVTLKHGTRAVASYAASELRRFPEVPKTHLPYWRAIQWAKEVGCAVFDLGGYVPDVPEDSPFYGINQFKRGLSTTQVNLVREHERIFSPYPHRLLSWMEVVADRIL